MSYKKDILYITALDETGTLCFASDEDKLLKKQYFCPCCKSEMILKKSGNEDNGGKRPHFAHKNIVDCEPESVLHYVFKTLLSEELDNRLKNKDVFNIEWNCQYCGTTHRGNLLKKVKNVFVEKDLGVCKPDILLVDQDDNPFVAIEIVVTHKPEENVLKYYYDNNIFLYQINLLSDNDLLDIITKSQHPSIFEFCPELQLYYKVSREENLLAAKFCPKCNSSVTPRTINIYRSQCDICDSFINVSRAEEPFNIINPSMYNQREINYVLENGVNLRTIYSNVFGKKINTIICPSCNSIKREVLADYCNQPIAFKSFPHCRNCYPITKEPKIKYDKRCEKGHLLTKRTTFVVEYNCYRCHQTIKIAFVKLEGGNQYSYISQEDSPNLSMKFRKFEKDFAERNGVFLDDANVYCPHCKAIISESYLWKYANCKEINHYCNEYCHSCYEMKKMESKFKL